jgi:DNA-binding transcriptional LysR family regulator
MQQWADRIGRRIKLRDLHVFQAVVQAGSMTKAAHQLAISVPVVSKAIADLEHSVGVQLLDREPQGVAPTAYGRALLHRSAIAFEELRQGIKDIEFLADPTVGEVRIGSTVTLAASFISAVIDRLSRRYPRIAFRVVAEGTEMLRDLSERSVDLLIYRQFTPFADERVSFEFLFESPYVVAAGANSPWLKRRRIALAELKDEPWALPPPEGRFGSYVVDVFRAAGLDFPRAAVVASALELRANLLKTGRYLAIFPDFWLKLPEPHPFIRKLPVDLSVASGPIGIVTLKNRALNPAAQLFIEAAREVAKPLAKRIKQ